MSCPSLAHVRSCLFVPLSQPRLFEKAHERGADAVVLDLEDGVAWDQKIAARERLQPTAEHLADRGLTVLARINNDPALLRADVQAAIAAGVSGIVLPKVASPEAVLHLIDCLELAERSRNSITECAGVVPLVESPVAVLNAGKIAFAHRRIVGVGFGSEDYCAYLGVPSHIADLTLPAHHVALAARAAGAAAFGVPASMTNFSDELGFARAALAARAIGFTGCFCIHPVQVRAANLAFLPTPEEIDQAKSIVQAAEKCGSGSTGAFALSGRMIDKPVVQNARRVLARAGAP